MGIYGRVRHVVFKFLIDKKSVKIISISPVRSVKIVCFSTQKVRKSQKMKKIKSVSTLISKTIAAIEAVNGEVKVLICDNNRVNQKLFKIMDAVSDKPWLTKAGRYLLFDFVHLLKSLRNNWLTERSKELLFYDNGVARLLNGYI